MVGQRLMPGYDGWFAGVPVHTNSLGFRDSREYALAKGPHVFRILVLGDSVTFGHGAIYETTYPYLLEQRLTAWRPDIAWQVWNLGVPGYNTSQELAYLLEIGRQYQPDLVIVGFFGNDLSDNFRVRPPSAARRFISFVQRQIQRRLYSYEFYKRAYLTATFRLRTDPTDRRRLEHLDQEERLSTATDAVADPRQRLSAAEFFDDDAVAALNCIGAPPPDLRGAAELRERLAHPSPDDELWLEAVRGFHHLAKDGSFRIMFFVNATPDVCGDLDRFYDGGSVAFDDALTAILGNGVPVVSSLRSFLHYRPSQMPLASAHAIGNSNRVKSDVLFEYLRSRPELLSLEKIETRGPDLR
jgi:hypothetical protein